MLSSFDLHKRFYLFCCSIFSTLSENDSCFLNKLGKAKKHQKTNANMCKRMRT